MQRLTISILLGVFSIHGMTQNRTIDSLVRSLNSQRIDSNIYNTCLLIAHAYTDSAYDKTLTYYNKALEIVERSSDRKKVAYTYKLIGYMYQKKGEFQAALENYSNALEVYKYLNNKTGVGQLLNDIGLIYKTWGKYDKALENYIHALKIFDEMGDAGNGAMATNNIGQIYYYRGEYEKAIDYFKKNLAFNIKSKIPRAIAGAVNNIASAFMELGKLNDAQAYYTHSMRIYDSLGIKIGVAVIKDNIGTLLLRKKQYTDALLYHSEALRIFEEIGSQSRLCATLHNMGLAYSRLNQPALAIKYLNRSFDIAIRLKQKETQKDVYNALSEVYMQTKQYERALTYYKLFVQIKDSLLNSETIGKIETIQAEYQGQKKEKELAEINQKLQNQKILVIISAGLFILFIFLTSLIVRENKRKKKVIKNSEKQSINLYSIIGKANQYLLSLQNDKVNLSLAFERSWQISSRGEDSCTSLPFLKDSFLLIAFLSKGNPSDNVDIVSLSIFDFFHSMNVLNNSLSIKEQYHNFISKESIWQKDIEGSKGINVDFWCIRKDNNQQQYSGSLSAFRVNNQNQVSNLKSDSNGWLNFEVGNRFYFYTTTHLDAFNPSEQEQFQNVLRKTIVKTMDIPFDEQKEIFNDSLELIDAGNQTHYDISIFAFIV